MKRSALRAPYLPLLALLCTVAACGGSSPSEPHDPPGGGSTLVDISPDSAVLVTGDTIRFTAAVQDEGGATVPGATVTWSSSAPSVATVSDEGLVTVLAPGSTVIAATASDAPGEATITAFAGSGTRRPGMESYDRIIPRLMAKWDIPGGAVAVVKDGKLVFARGYGYADTETHEAVQEDALFRIASISKPITSAAILKLVEGGELSLDDKPFVMLSDLTAPSGATEDPRLANITVRQILHHAGGWDRGASGDPMFMSTEIAQALGTTPPASTEDIIRYMRGQPLDFDPGTRYSYSNFGYAVLGRVIEKVTGQSYEDYMKSAVLSPMGITRMTIGATLLSGRADGEVKYYHPGVATSVFPGGGSVPWPYGGFYLEAMDSHGAWIASTVDLLRFLTHIDPRTARTPFLSSASTTMMLARPAAPLWAGSAYWYGMGWLVRPSGDDANWWHDGSLPGTTTLLVRAFNGLDWVAFFNARASSQSGSFAAELDQSLWTASSAVTEWPTGDLFGDYP